MILQAVVIYSVIVDLQEQNWVSHWQA